MTHTPRTHRLRHALGLALSALALSTQAHITLPPASAAAGSLYEAAFRVGHACRGASATTAITVRLPEGFTLAAAKDRPGWALKRTAQEVSWTALTPQNALAGSEKTHFELSGRLPDQAGTLWFKVLQVCDQGQADWAEIPVPGGAKPAFPAARLDVVAPAGLATQR